MKRILLTIIMLVSLVFASRAEKVTVTISVLEPGTLNEVLGDRALDMDSLIVSGYLNKADFEALASYGSYKRMYGLNLKDCVLENKELPRAAFLLARISHITLPEDLEVVGSSAFSGMQMETIELPSTLKELGNATFSNSEMLKSIIIPENALLEVIPEDCFSECKSLEKLALPKNIHRLESDCFSFAAIKELELPEKVEYIGERAINTAYMLGIIKSRCISPPHVEGVLLDDDDRYDNLTLYVPVGCAEVYRAHPEWGKFENIIESAELGTSGIEAVKAEAAVRVVGDKVLISCEGENVTYSIYDTNGALMSTGDVNGNAEITGLPKGCYIVKCADNTTKVVI